MESICHIRTVGDLKRAVASIPADLDELPIEVYTDHGSLSDLTISHLEPTEEEKKDGTEEHLTIS